MTPTERADAVEAVCRYGWSGEEAESLIADLEQAGVLVPTWDRHDRYDRHQLYYRMLGADDDSQQRLANTTIGLIGMGGIGTHLALHLAAAGIGRLVITDGDTVELSNLTRQTLFQEEDVGRHKVNVAAERLRALRSDLDIEIIARRFDGPDLAEAVASRSDLVLVSADRPAEVHSWANAACVASGQPFSTAGYIEGHGCIGPLLSVPDTPCFECIRIAAEALAEQPLDPASVQASRIELNPAWQAPSYGPLNAMVASVQANEAIRWILGMKTATVGRRLLIDSRTYETTWEDFEVSDNCDVCGRQSSVGTMWDDIAGQYEDERELHSFNAILLDDLIHTLLPPLDGRTVADVGAGSGQITTSMVKRGAIVHAYEPQSAMRLLLNQRLASNGTPAQVLPCGIDGLADKIGAYDVVCCLNVLDHVPDLLGAMRTLSTALRPGGTLVLSVPHPFKDRGGWRKTPRALDWAYAHFIVDNYFDEGTCTKVREDRYGNVRVRDVTSYHRTASTYLNTVLESGLRVTRVVEPAPASEIAEREPVIYDKASRIPYFLVIEARRDQYA
ncbi:MAG: ThiF family adenylyltransferase [Pseudonocardiaceae bacterium]